MKKISKNKKYFAFTLAEVLIVLGIIGIVAAFTIPTLVEQFNEQVTSTSLKKVYTTLSQAYISALQQNGKPDTWNLIYNSAQGSKNFTDKLLPYMKILKEEDYSTAVHTLYLVDGAKLMVWIGHVNCDQQISPMINNNCGVIVYTTKPQEVATSGKNVFWFYILDDKILPFGAQIDTESSFKDYCKRTDLSSDIWGSYGGRGCAAWVIYNENMDYLHCDDLAWDGKHKCS